MARILTPTELACLLRECGHRATDRAWLVPWSVASVGAPTPGQVMRHRRAPPIPREMSFAVLGLTHGPEMCSVAVALWRRP